MKKKFWVVLMTLLAAMCVCLGLAACDKTPANPSGGTQQGGSQTPEDGELWTIERVYYEAHARGYSGTLEDVLALFNGKGKMESVAVKSMDIGEDGHLRVTLSGDTVIDFGEIETSPSQSEGTVGLAYRKARNEQGEESVIVSGIGSAIEIDVVIPETYEGLPVTGIGSSAFARDQHLTSITIPKTITEIGADAFYGCDSLEAIYISDLAAWCGIDFENEEANPFQRTTYMVGMSVPNRFYINNVEATALEIPQGVTEIKPLAFVSCLSLKSVRIPRSVTSIGDEAFYYCTALEAVTIESSAIGEGAFSGCDGLKNVTIGSGVTSIGSSAFSGCRGLTSIEIPGNVTSIGSSVFSGCSGLTSIEIPDNVTSMGGWVFSGCSGLESVALGSGVTSIGDYTFSECGKLASIEIPDTVALIGDYTFSECGKLASIVIPDTVASIGEYAFYNCIELTKVTVGTGVKSIGDDAFSGCYKLIEVWNYSQLKFIVDSSSSGGIAQYAKHVYTEETPSKQVVKDDYLFYEEGDEVYLLGYVGESTELTLPTSSPSGKRYAIWQYAFYYCSGLTSITIGSGVTSIEVYAFSGCGGLTGELKIPDTVTSVGWYAFDECYRLESVAIGGGSIGSYAFQHCSGLESVTIGDGVTSIRDYAFSYCSGLESVIWNAENCTTAWSSSSLIFSECTNLKTVTFGEKVKTIPSRAFYDCSGLTGVYITNLAAWCEIDFLDDDANPLYYAHHLYLDGEEVKNLTIPAEVAEIKKYAFYGCSGLQSVTIENGSIGSSAFYGCSGLQSVTIGSGVTEIGWYAFEYCSGLTSVTIGSGVTSIRDYAFYGCGGLKVVYYKGTPAEWNGIQDGSNNGYLTEATYYFSAETPSAEQWEESSNWWHYEADGETIVLWTKEQA